MSRGGASPNSAMLVTALHVMQPKIRCASPNEPSEHTRNYRQSVHAICTRKRPHIRPYSCIFWLECVQLSEIEGRSLPSSSHPTARYISIVSRTPPICNDNLWRSANYEGKAHYR
jgi:hypothetical protein